MKWDWFNKIFNMANVTINGKSFSGRNISIHNDKIIIDGKSVEMGDEKIFNINIEGDVENLETVSPKSFTVKGNVNNLSTVSGDVEVGGHVSGSIQTVSGDVRCANVGGSINTVSGDIKHTK